MFTYWLLFLIPAFASLAIADRGVLPGGRVARLTPGWIAFGALLVATIGFRYEVGGDWFNYLGHLAEDSGQPLGALLVQRDPGYKFITWLSVSLGWGIYGINTLGALMFTCGLIAFCRGMPRPWLAISVAVPYLIVVVAMGYTRQGIALGLAMLGLRALERRSTFKFAMWILLGATVHSSALVLLPIAALATPRNRWWITFWVGILIAVAYLSLVESSSEALYANYVTRGYNSQGAIVRLSMNAVAAILFLKLHRRFMLDRPAEMLWRWMAFLSIGLFAAVFASSGISTALDRLGLYLLPLQLLVFSSLPNAMGGKGKRKPWVFAVLAYYALILLVWLNFANNAYAWLPYRFYLLVPAA
jgi:hypothetical protein